MTQFKTRVVSGARTWLAMEAIKLAAARHAELRAARITQCSRDSSWMKACLTQVARRDLGRVLIARVMEPNRLELDRLFEYMSSHAGSP